LELLLIGTRGRLWVPPARGLQPPQVMRITLPEEAAPIVTLPRGRHSAKPDLFYDEMAKMFPGVPRLEMFARGPRADWDVSGGQSAG
jgi:N6-adenosine-specific RNA methylase IME4